MINDFLQLKLQPIKAVLFDADGVLTNGQIIIDSRGEEIKAFHVKDGQFFPFMRYCGFVLGCISGRHSTSLATRMEALKVHFVKTGVKKKSEAYQFFKQTYGLTDEQIVYIGDDINDLKVIKQVGFSVAPSDGLVQKYYPVDYICEAKGGEGVLREIFTMLVEAQNLESKLEEFIEKEL